jgi:hypothetical protein
MARHVSPATDAPSRSALADLLRSQQRALTRDPYRQWVAFGQWRIEQAMDAGTDGGVTWQAGDAVLVHGPTGRTVAVLGTQP